ncbi:hypothetical protein MASR2M16_31240 [Thauera terpenica]
MRHQQGKGTRFSASGIRLGLGAAELISRGPFATLRPHQIEQKLRCEVSTIPPCHRSHHGMLARSGEQRRVAQRLKYLAFQFGRQINLARYAAIEAQEQPAVRQIEALVIAR